MRLTSVLLMTITMSAPASAQWPARTPRADVERAMMETERAMVQAGIAVMVSPKALREAELALAGAQIALSVAPMALRDVDRMLEESSAIYWFDRSAGHRSIAHTPPASWDQQDPADSIYRAARQYLNRSDYVRAAELFGQIRSRYPKSSYTPDSYYWQAYALYRRGGTEQLRRAQRILEEQASQYASAATRKSGDARTLETRVQGALARTGDRVASEAVVIAANPPEAPVAAAAPNPPSIAAAPRPPRGGQRRAATRCSDDDDVQVTALNALMQMDGERAMPILKKVLARRDEESTCLRRKAVFIVSQVGGRETEAILLTAARTDPDREVKGQAVFWLSQVDSDRAVVALDSILADSDDREIQDKAVFALSQHDSRAARQALRRYAERASTSPEVREKAVFWLGQSDDPEDATFLRTLYPKVTDFELKDKILFALSQNDDAGSGRFLAEIARNTGENIELRKKALFWLGQRDEMNGAEIAALYGTFTDRQIKEQLIFVLSQKDDKASIDKLIDIARREPDRELRKKAIFWLGQSDDPRVPDILASLLEKP